MRALKFGLVKKHIYLFHKLQISFNLVPGQLRNLRAKLEQILPNFNQILDKIVWVFLEKSLILCFNFHMKTSYNANMTPRRSKSTSKGTGLASRRPKNQRSVHAVTENVILCSSVGGGWVVTQMTTKVIKS